jgi:hypothetical protein
MDTTSTGRRRNRSWPEALKREIVAGFEVNANQLFGWRKFYREGVLGPADATGPALVPVTVTAARGGDASPGSRAADMIEIELAGYRVRVGSGVDGKALRRVLDLLERR